VANVRIDKQIEPGLRVNGFAGQIDQVFMNLITNAAQAIGDRASGGAIRISAARAGDDIEIAIADDGPGIRPSHPRIFDPFFTTKDVGEGSGWGCQSFTHHRTPRRSHPRRQPHRRRHHLPHHPPATNGAAAFRGRRSRGPPPGVNRPARVAHRRVSDLAP